MPKVTVLISLTLFLLANLVLAQPSPSVVADQVPNNGPVYYQHEKNVARASNGVLMVAWQDLAGTGGQVVYSTYDDVFGIWNPTVPISAATVEADEVALAADDQGRIHATWKQNDTGAPAWQVYYAKFEGGSFSTPVKVSTNDTLDAEESSIEVDSNGRIFIVWNTDDEPDGDEWILCSISADGGSTWSTPDTLSSSDGVIKGTSITSARVSLYPGSFGKMAAAWHEDYPGREREIHVNLYNGVQWQGAVVVSDTTAAVSRNWYPTICLDSEDDIHVMYSDDQSGSDPRHILHTMKTWSAPQWPAVWDTVDVTTEQDYLSVTSTVDPNDDLHIAFRRSIPGDTLGLEEIAYKVSQDGGQTWSAATALSRPDHDAAYPTFAARVFGDRVEISWRESRDTGIDDQDTTTILYGYVDIATGIDTDKPVVSGAFQLHQNYPNPFNPTTQIIFVIGKKGRYDLSVYSLLGQKVKTLISGDLLQGDQSVVWDGTDRLGHSIASGIYFYKLEGEGISLSKKMILIR